LIIAVLGVPGALLGGLLVEVPKFGRRGTLCVSTVLTGVFLYCSTTAVSSAALLGWQCAFNFFSNIMYAVLYGFTPEIFATKDRGRDSMLLCVFDVGSYLFRNRKCVDCHSEPSVWNYGSNYRNVRGLDY